MSLITYGVQTQRPYRGTDNLDSVAHRTRLVYHALPRGTNRLVDNNHEPKLTYFVPLAARITTFARHPLYRPCKILANGVCSDCHCTPRPAMLQRRDHPSRCPKSRATHPNPVCVAFTEHCVLLWLYALKASLKAQIGDIITA